MRRCLRLRPSIPLLPPRQFARFIRTAPLARAPASFTDFRRSAEEEEVEEDEEFLDDDDGSWNRESDETAYAEHTGEKSTERWRESQDPQAGLQFMTMGREFTIPYSLTQLSNMSNNHLRELRAYYRKMMYEMPQFRKFHRPFRPPTPFEVLQFRYTSYLGASHPSARKVVLRFPVKQLREALKSDPRINDVWEHKFKLLLGQRYNLHSDMVHMSCDSLEYPAQNKKWLSDKIDDLINMAATGESYSDIPIDDRHVKKSRTYQIPKEWLKVSPERRAAEQAVDEHIFQPALAKCVKLAGVASAEALPQGIEKRLRSCVNATVRHAVRPSVYADLNDPKVRELIVDESLKHLVWSFQKLKTQHTEFITPHISEEEFATIIRAEQERLVAKEREDKLQMEEDRRQRLYDQQQAYASENVIDEIEEVTPQELQRAQASPAATESDDNLDNLGLDQQMINALKKREERRKMILSQLDEPDVPEWLKHAVDRDDTEYFPMASGRFTKEKGREDLLADFFQSELDDMAVGSEEENAVLDFLEKFTEQEESGLLEQESVEEVKKRVNTMLKEIEDRKAKKEA